jgi:DNA-binding NarL/FixJ family response regulator
MIVDDHLVVREGLKQLLEINDEIEVVAEATNGLECLDRVGDYNPDIVFIDIKMPGISGIDTTRLIRQKHPDVKVIMLTIYDDGELVANAINAGANGYMMKNALREDLINAIHQVMKGQAFLDPSVTSTLVDQIKRRPFNLFRDEKLPLTRRELEVLESIVLGLTDKETAERLHISEHTVRTHAKSLYRKLGVSSRSQAAVHAVHQGIIDQEKLQR